MNSLKFARKKSRIVSYFGKNLILLRKRFKKLDKLVYAIDFSKDMV